MERFGSHMEQDLVSYITGIWPVLKNCYIESAEQKAIL
jgi:hypothetical protein